MGESIAETAKVYKALGDENRLKIMALLKGGEKCACKLLEALDVTQPTLSHHMKILCDSGLVSGRKEGKWMQYSISEKGKPYAEKLEADDIGDGERIDSCMCSREQQNMEGEEKMPGKTKLYVLSGFLGSGKTTLLLKLIEELKDKRIGIIQNEFGKLGIDGTILRDGDIQMKEINKGSIFCSCLKLSFVQALAEMADQKFEYLFVESSGWGDPSNVDEILGAVKAMAGDRYDFKGMLCLVDALNFLELLDDEETVRRQIKHCHMAVLTKVDLVDGEHVDVLKEKIRQINPVCKIKLSSKGNLDLSFLQKDLLQYRWAETEDTTNSVETKPKSLFMNVEEPVAKDNLEMFLRELADDMYRMKGFFRLTEDGWNQVDVVGKQIDYKPCDGQEKSQMVFISKIGPAAIRKIVAAWEKNMEVKMELKN